MRTRHEIEKDPKNYEALLLEVLLDLRDLLRKDEPVEAPLYISDKEPKPRKKRRTNKKNNTQPSVCV